MPDEHPGQPKRTIDERIDAIAQRLELLTSMHIDLEGKHAELAQQHAELEKQTAQRFAETLVFINRLAHIAEAHEQRLDDLDGGNK